MTTNEENVDVVERNLTSFRITVEEFKRCVAALLDDLETEEELSVANDWYAEQNEHINVFIEKVMRWISSAKETIEQNLENRSQASSKHTRTSHHSQTSSRPSIAASRAKEKAKAAELMTRVAMLERRQELEKTAERLRLEEQLEVARVRERVYAEIENGVKEDLDPQSITPTESSRVLGNPFLPPSFTSVSSTYTTPVTFTTPIVTSTRATSYTTGHFNPPGVRIPSNAVQRPKFNTSAAGIQVADMQKTSKPVQYSKSNPFRADAEVVEMQQSTESTQYSKDNPFAPECHVVDMRQSTKQFCDVLQKQNKLTQLLAEQQQQSLLPSLTLTKFTGDPLDYSTFIRSFESQVEARVSANDVRLQYLEQYLEGEPKELIKGCLHLDNHSGYQEAKRLLKDKYGDPYKISNAYIKRINEWPTIRPGDERALDKFSVFLTQCRSAISTLTFLSVLDHPHNLQSMVSKLPFPLQDRWRREANKMRTAKGEIPTFADFVKFVNAEAGIATDPVFSREALRRLDSTPRSTSDRSDRSNKGKVSGKSKRPGDRTREPFNISSHATDVTADRESISRLCKLCGKNHDLDDCKAYLKKTLPERKEFLKRKGLCFACYDTGHRSNGCAQRRTCKTCSRRHPTGLHDDNFRSTQPASEQQSSPPSQQENVTVNAQTEIAEAICNAAGAENSVSAVPIVPVRLRYAESEVLTYAMLDTCSTGSFVLEDIAVSLGVKGSHTQLMVKTVNGVKLHHTKVLNGLIVTDLNGDHAVQLPKIYTKEDLSTCENVPSPEFAYQWKHLERIARDLPPQLPGAKIGLLIGSNCPKALEPMDVLASEDGGPFAIKTFAGWAIVGPLYMSDEEHRMVDCNRVVAKEVGSGRNLDHHFAMENKVREIVTPQELNKMLELDFSERTDDNGQEYSQEDKTFLKIVNHGVRRTDDNHYEIPLPFRRDDPCFPENREQVLQRARWLKRKLIRSDTFYKDYVSFMNGIIAKGFARKVPSHLLSAKPGQLWYIPHHGVYHAKKPEKIRVVFDCSARFGGISLNDQLLQGPDLTNRLVGVLTRFRQNPVAFMGDIDAMFHQVRVPEDQRDFLRFLWWPGGDFTQDLAEYQMNVHLFGAISSPSCSNYALRRSADDAESVVGSETADVLRKNFYVDDCLRSEETEESAIQRIQGVRDACAHGGFNLAKFVSNSRTVLASVPEEARAQDVRSLELGNGYLPVERALGVQWAIESDMFGFRIILKDQPLTRRGILSTISSVYDPLGIAAPYLLVGKKILQDLCRTKLGWDEEIDEECRVRWENWKSQLPALERFSMERCLKPANFGTVVSRQIHNFSDASSTGYGQVSYLRIENENGDIHCAFLMGKARVAPVKTMTIPRLELTAATVSVRVGEMVARELDEPVERKTYWTDSTTVLKYIRNEKRRFHVFVANRVQTIREVTNHEQWKYVETKINPADDASRGLKGYELTKQHRWITGPNFLWLPESEWPQLPCDLDDVSADDPEVKKVLVHSLDVSESSDLLTRLTRFSDWQRMKRSVAWILRLRPKLSDTLPSRNRARRVEDGANLKDKPLRVDEVERAEKAILKLVQKVRFLRKLKHLRRPEEQIARTTVNLRELRRSKSRKQVLCIALILSWTGTACYVSVAG